MAKKRANGEGNIRKRADGRWEGRYTAGYHPETGKRIIKNVLGKTQAECKAKLSAAMEASRGIDVSRADEYTVATWLRSWYELYAKPNIRISTANRYQLMVEQYTIPRIGSIKLTKLTAHDLQKLYKDLMENGRIDRKSGHGNPGLSSTTVRSLHLMLHNAFERAVKERLIPFMVSECGRHGVSRVYFMLTDIMEQSTELLFYGEGSEEMAVNAFKIEPKDGTIYLKGVVSRKKQLIPPLMEAAQMSGGDYV